VHHVKNRKRLAFQKNINNMRGLILNFLKENNLDIGELIGKDSINATELTQWKEKHPIIDKIEYEGNEVGIYLKNLPMDIDFEPYHNFSKKLINLINENSEQKVEGPNYLGMFGWQSGDLFISFGVNDEPLSFEARFSFKIDSIQ
jgi:hypothetical protein